MKIDSEKDLRELKSKYDLLEKIDYGVDFLKVYSEYLGIAEKINNQNKIYTRKSLNLQDEPFMFISTTIYLLERIYKARDTFIKEYKKESLEKDIGEIRTNLAVLSKRLGDVRFEAQFLHTQDLFNDFLDHVKTTTQGNKLFLETDLANFFHTLVNLIKLQKNNLSLNMTPLETMSSLDAYGIATQALALVKTKSILPTSDNSGLEVKLSEMLTDWITNPKNTKKEMMNPVHLIQDKYSRLINTNSNENFISKKTKGSKYILPTFPPNLMWEEITIRFLNGDEVIVTTKDETLHTDYKLMGFQNEKENIPNNQWDLLKILAIKNGRLSWDNNSNLSLKKINSIKKQKQKLAETLKAYFQIHDSEPFLDYKTEKAYVIKIKLTPENSISSSETISAYDDLEEYKKEQSPEIFEE